jgi:type II secretory pathway pseudopilin PulG
VRVFNPPETTVRRFRQPRAFTLIELIVVIGVLILLAGLIIGGASHALRIQRIAATRAILNNLTTAISQFQAEAPLATTYNVRGSTTFGTLPPYMLAGARQANHVADLIEPSATTTNFNNRLGDRLTRDWGGTINDAPQYARIATETMNNSLLGRDDDNRSLYIYLKTFSPGTISQVSDSYMKRLVPADPQFRHDYFNPKGEGVNLAQQEDVLDVLAFHDSWGVPLDYVMFAKLGWNARANGGQGEYTIVERRGVIRSRGLDRESYDARVVSASSNAQVQLHTSKEIWSEDLPQPFAFAQPGDPFATNGRITQTASRWAGWVRILGREHFGSDTYRP